MPVTQKGLKIHIRWMIRRDLDEVMDIERASFEDPLTQEMMLEQLRRRDRVSRVAELNDVVVGYMMYDLKKSHIKVVSIAVHPALRRQGIAAQMIDLVKSKLYTRRPSLIVNVRESDLQTQQFLRSQSLRCDRILKGYFADAGEDAYLMTYRFNPQES